MIKVQVLLPVNYSSHGHVNLQTRSVCTINNVMFLLFSDSVNTSCPHVHLMTKI